MSDFLIEPFQLSDVALITALTPEGWNDITVPFTYYCKSPHCFPLKITINNQIIAVGTTITHEDTVWLAAIIVHPQHRNKGLGTIITKKLINSVNKSIATIYLDATDFGFPVYTKLGFVLETYYAHFKGELPENKFEVSSNVIHFDPKYQHEVLALDREISGEDRNFILNEHITNAFIYVDRGVVHGAYFPTLLEGYIMAQTDESGVELMKHRLNTRNGAVMPIQNTCALKFLEASHLTQYRTSRRMRLGPERAWKPEGIFNRVSGQLG